MTCFIHTAIPHDSIARHSILQALKLVYPQMPAQSRSSLFHASYPGEVMTQKDASIALKCSPLHNPKPQRTCPVIAANSSPYHCTSLQIAQVTVCNFVLVHTMSYFIPKIYHIIKIKQYKKSVFKILRHHTIQNTDVISHTNKKPLTSP